ncbi:hypothetical protein TNCV_3072731 [Trichonephila clavipes]|nr:hypothetical protein TNCV_3072731 [Trichonephila clavipes]
MITDGAKQPKGSKILATSESTFAFSPHISLVHGDGKDKLVNIWKPNYSRSDRLVILGRVFGINCLLILLNGCQYVRSLDTHLRRENPSSFIISFSS